MTVGPSGGTVGRRAVIRLLAGGLAVGVAAVAGQVVAAFLASAGRVGGRRRERLGSVADLRARVDASPSGTWLDADRRILYLPGPDGGVVGLSTTCTHLGCALAPTADLRHLACACHGSRFLLLEDGRAGEGLGRVVQGPATRDLPRVDLVRSGDGLYREVET